MVTLKDHMFSLYQHSHYSSESIQRKSVNLHLQVTLLFSFLICTSGLVKGQNHEEFQEFHHCYFNERSLSIGTAASSVFPSKILGVNNRLYYNLAEQLCFGPEYSWFGSGDLKVHEVNLVGHYIFETPLVGIYPVIGINYTSEVENHHAEKGFSGLAGLGLHRNFRKFTLFGEWIKVEGAFSESIFNAGLMYTFKL